MPAAPRTTSARTHDEKPRASSRSKREEILSAATAYFGEYGYEDTKWSEVARAVGIGQTALYHYFVSKLHCVYVILADALGRFSDEFERITKDHEDFLEALILVLCSGYALSEQDVLRNRVLIAEQGLVGIPRKSRHEEDARLVARRRMSDIEFAWSTFLARGMKEGQITKVDPRLLTRAVLGLYNSVWHWYRPHGEISLEEVSDFVIRRQLAMLSVPPEWVQRRYPSTASRTSRDAVRHAPSA